MRRSARALGALGDVLRGIESHDGELRESRAALAASRNEMRELIERLPDGVLVHRAGVVRWVNAAMVQVLGVKRREDVIGRSVTELVPPQDGDALVTAAERRMRGGNDPHPELTVRRPDGTLRHLQSGVTQVVELDGEKVRMVVLRDVTDERRMREQAAIADRLASLGALAAGVGHEINNPLAYVRLSLESAIAEASAEGTRSSPALRDALARSLEGTDRVLAIVRDLKVFSRVHDEPIEAIDLPALLESTRALAERAVTLKARVVRSYGATPRALAARGKLGQVFLNLLTNAADAIPEGSPAAHQVRVATRADASGGAVVEVSDTGGGIPRDVAGRVFDPFFTTKPVGSGTGLGLAMCHRIVTELGGRIEFDSAPGATTFRVTLPAAPADALERSESAVKSAPPPASPRGRVLVVDDEPSLLSAIETLLGDHHDVVTAPGPREALATLADDHRFDVVLTDLDDGRHVRHRPPRHGPRPPPRPRAPLRLHDRRRVLAAGADVPRRDPEPVPREAVRGEGAARGGRGNRRRGGLRWRRSVHVAGVVHDQVNDHVDVDGGAVGAPGRPRDYRGALSPGALSCGAFLESRGAGAGAGGAGGAGLAVGAVGSGGVGAGSSWCGTSTRW